MKKLFSFAATIQDLKKIERFKGQYYWKLYPLLPRYESVADHSWRLAVLVLLFADKLSKKINLLKALKMALIHDLPEVIAGDGNPLGNDGKGGGSYAFDKKNKTKRHLVEKRAAKILFAKLGGRQKKEFIKLWLEYEEGKSFEAKVVAALDKLEAYLQVLEYRKGHMHKDHLKFCGKYCLQFSAVDPAIERFGKMIDKETRKRYKEFKG